MATVIVDIGEDGDVTVEAQGVKGAGCEALTRAFERDLGTVTGDRKKPEFYQTEQQHARRLAGQ